MKINWHWKTYVKEVSVFVGKFKLFLNLKFLRNCTHGPASESWPWYKLVGFKYCNREAMTKGGVHLPSTCRRLWIYLRWLGGIHFDFVIDRRVLFEKVDKS